MNIDELMLKLKNQYIESLPDKIQNLRDLLNQKDYATLQMSFHKLKGSGKTHGVAEVSVLGKIVENQLITKPDQRDNIVLNAIEVLKKIHSNRINEEELNLNNDENFKKIERI